MQELFIFCIRQGILKLHKDWLTVMQKILYGLALLSALLITQPTNAKGNVIRGKQYIVLGGGAKPVSDNTIFYRGCYHKNECLEFELAYKKAILNEPSDLGKIRQIGQILEQLNQMDKVGTVQTDFNGNYSFQCPTSQCLVFSDGSAGLAKVYWLKTIKANSRLDLTNSNALYLFNRY